MERRRYMSKAQRACDGCRARKSACQIDSVPPCRLCRAHGQACEFTSRPQRRRSPLTTATPSTNADPPQYCMPNQTMALNGQSLLADTDIGPVGDSMLNELVLGVYEPSQSPFHQAPALPAHPLNNVANTTAQLCGFTGDMDPYVLQHYQFNDNSEFVFSKLTVRQVQQSEVPVQFLLSKKDSAQDDSTLSELGAIVPSQIGERLINLFFRFIQPQFPILSENSRPDPTSSPVHLLAAIYAIAQPFATFDDHLSIELVYTPPSAQTLLDMAQRGLYRAQAQPTISSIQTALVLLLQLPTDSLVLDSPSKWSLLGTTVSMAQTLGLHLDSRCWNLPEPEIMLRRKLSWIVYSFDKWFAFSLGRPSHISRDDWLVTEISSQDMALEKEQTSIFAFEFSRLTTVLDMTLSRLYSIRATAALSRDFRITFDTARPLLTELAQWSLQGALARDQGLAPLYMAYHAIKLLILRTLLRPFNRTEVEFQHGESAEFEAAKTHIRQAAKLEIEATLSRISSLEAVDYQAFWAPWYKTCFALITHLAFILAVTAYNRDQPPQEALGDPEYVASRKLLDRARETLRLHSRGLDIVRFALLRIDAVFWMGWDKVLGFE